MVTYIFRSVLLFLFFFFRYVSLSDNEKTGFMARELKSVHVDALGTYLRMNIHKNHINKHNLYNQVGIVAINIIGDVQRKPFDPSDPVGFLSLSLSFSLLWKYFK